MLNNYLATSIFIVLKGMVVQACLLPLCCFNIAISTPQKSERCIHDVLTRPQAVVLDPWPRTSAPAVERAITGVVDVVEAVAEIDDVFISAAAFDDRVVQVAGQKVNIGPAEDDRFDLGAGCVGIQLILYLVAHVEVSAKYRGPLVRQQLDDPGG